MNEINASKSDTGTTPQINDGKNEKQEKNINKQNNKPNILRIEPVA